MSSFRPDQFQNDFCLQGPPAGEKHDSTIFCRDDFPKLLSIPGPRCTEVAAIETGQTPEGAAPGQGQPGSGRFFSGGGPLRR